MHIKKIYKIMEGIDERLEQLTQEELTTYCYGDGLMAILENSIDEVLWDDESKTNFWKTYQSHTYDGTPYENCIAYEILYKYFNAAVIRAFKKFETEDDDE